MNRTRAFVGFGLLLAAIAGLVIFRDDDTSETKGTVAAEPAAAVTLGSGVVGEVGSLAEGN